MKKITILYALFISTFFLSSQGAIAQTDYKLDSLQTFVWDNPILPNDWLMQIRDHFTYDNGGVNWTGHLTLIKDNNTSAWPNAYNQIRTFNGSNQLETDIFQIWTGTEFMNSSKQEYSYDGSGNNDVLTRYSYYPSPVDWLPTSQDLMTYNGSNLVVEKTSQNYNLGTMMYVNNSQTTYTYSGELLMQEDTHYWNGADYNSPPFERTLYNYSGTLVTDITMQVDPGTGFTNTMLTTFTYDGNNLDTITTQSWDGSMWVDVNLNDYTYNVNDLPEEVITYTSLGPSTWGEVNKVIYYWSEAALGVTSNVLSGGKAVPNPFTSYLNITLKSSLESQGTLSIFDIHGMEISQTQLNQGAKSIQINNPNLSQGVYFVKISSTSGNQTFKVIKQ